MTDNRNLPIGVFDSGVGGLTVVKEIIKELPNERLIYLGDTARVPYGTRSREVIQKFALELTRFLLSKKVKCLVVACNTMSANALPAIKSISPVPVLDVIFPTVAAAVEKSKSGRIGVIGTAGTVSSGAYNRELKPFGVKVFSVACPLFVPLAEEGMGKNPATELIAREYLLKLSKEQIDTLILGCTHFPLLRQAIGKAIGEKVKLVDSGKPTAMALRIILRDKDLLSDQAEPAYEFYFTDALDKASAAARNFFGGRLPGKIVKISL